MRKLLLVIGLSVLASGCGSSSSAPDPVTACKNLFSAVCNKVFQCFPTQAAQAYPGGASACASSLSATECTAANTTCPTGKTFNSSAASTCINDVSSASCPADIGSVTTPASCDTVCQ